MKLEKLLTLSQFVDYVSKQRPFATTAPMSEEADNYTAIYDYNEFLKQPLTKEMFVNPMEEPTLQYSDPMYYECEMIKWQEAESKVIFENWTICKNGYYLSNNLTINSTALNVSIDDYHSIEGYNTLHDLAEATQGQLNLKNVTL